MNVSEFQLGVDGKAYIEYDNGMNVELDLTKSLTSNSTSSKLNAIDYGIYPDTGEDITAKLQTAMTACRVTSKVLEVLPGKYIYSGLVNNAGGGLVCSTGIAWFDNIDPTYTNMRIDFASTDSSWLPSVTIQGVKFTCSTRPDVGLANGATEVSHFIRITKARNVKVWGNDFSHNFGGAVLCRDVEDASIIGNKASDIWKDAFHITGASKNIVRAYNIVRGGGDDAFPVVGYVTQGVYPERIADIGNRVFGVRKARAFAYVGCKGWTNTDCLVDGNIPEDIPQQNDGDGGKYGTACALYIAAESAFNSYGVENGVVKGFIAENIGSGINGSATLTSSLQAIHIAASNGATYPIKNIKIQANLRNISQRGFYASGNGYCSNLDLDIVVSDNTDPFGKLSLTSTPASAAANKNAMELVGVKDFKIKLQADKIAAGGLYVGNNCTGEALIDVSVGSISQVTAGSTPIQLQTSSTLQIVDFKLNVETSPAASGVGSWNRIIDNSNQGITRSCVVTGVDHATAAANVLSGWPTRVITMGSSPSSFLNTTGRPLLFYVRGGTVSAIARASVRGRAVATAVTTGASGTVQIQGDFTDIYTAATVVTLFGARGVSIATGVVASSSLSGGVTTVTFDATGVNASFAVGMQLAAVNTMRTIPSRTNGVIELPAETAIQVTYSVTPTVNVTDQSF